MLFDSKAIITQYWGKDPDYYGDYDLLGHDGLDCKPSEEDWGINCIMGGVVTEVYFSTTYGNTIITYNPDFRTSVRYAHLDKIYISNGWPVAVGVPLGTMGDTGNTTGSHLHIHFVPMEAYGIKLHENNGYKGRVDPLQYLETNRMLG